jgi:two-component system cell cycle sensor histidine kinase/response regulator CckA
METVLLVDDDEMVLTLCCFILRASGLKLMRAEDGEEAIRLAIKFRGTIELLLSDIVMPGAMNGIQLARKLCEIKPGVKVVLMSGYNEEAFQLDPSWRFLPKPFNPATLISTVGATLGHEVSAGIAR